MATSSKVLISVQHLVKEYNHGAVHALNDCNLDIHKGEVVAIIGPSGSGKSTLLRSLNLLEEPTSGAIFFDGADLAGKSVNIDLHRQKMGMVFQHFNLFPHKTVLQNITMAPVTLKKKTAAAAKEQAMALLERSGLADKANEFPNMLSGGQKQRIAIVRALAMDPEVMLFDEPTSALVPPDSADFPSPALAFSLLLLSESRSASHQAAYTHTPATPRHRTPHSPPGTHHMQFHIHPADPSARGLPHTPTDRPYAGAPSLYLLPLLPASHPQPHRVSYAHCYRSCNPPLHRKAALDLQANPHR